MQFKFFEATIFDLFDIHRRRRLNARGLTIAELVIGIVILGLMLIYTFSMFSAEIGTISRTRDYSAAVLVAQETIESIKNFPFDKIDDADAGNESIEACLNGAATSPQYQHIVNIGKIAFERNVTITDITSASGLPLSLKAVELEIKWKSEDNKSLSYRIATCVTKTH
jgi:hypothetical protein